MNVNHLILNGIKQTEKLLGCPTFTWQGNTFNCVPNTLDDSIKDNSNMFNENADFRMTVRLDQFTNGIYPQLNDYVYYNAKQLIIKHVRQTPHNVFWVFICSMPTIND